MKTTIYEILSLDVLGNKNDGFEINQTFNTGLYIEVLDSDTENDILKKAKKVCGIKNRIKYTCNQTEDSIDFDIKSSGKPAIYMNKVEN